MNAFIRPILLAILLFTVCRIFEPLTGSKDDPAKYSMTAPNGSGSGMLVQEDDVIEDDEVLNGSAGCIHRTLIQKITAPHDVADLKEHIKEIIPPPPQA